MTIAIIGINLLPHFRIRLLIMPNMTYSLLQTHSYETFSSWASSWIRSK